MHLEIICDIILKNVGGGIIHLQILYTVLTVLGCIFALFVLLIVLLLFSRLSLRVKYDGELYVYGGLGFLRTKIYPEKEVKKVKKRKKIQQDIAKMNSRRKKEGIDTVLPSAKELDEIKKSVKETLSMLLEVIVLIGEVLGKSGKIKISRLNVVVSKPDAEQTAVQFGICCGIVSNILSACSVFGESVIKDNNVSVVPDFCGKETSAVVDVTVSFRVISLFQ